MPLLGTGGTLLFQPGPAHGFLPLVQGPNVPGVTAGQPPFQTQPCLEAIPQVGIHLPALWVPWGQSQWNKDELIRSLSPYHGWGWGGNGLKSSTGSLLTSTAEVATAQNCLCQTSI